MRSLLSRYTPEFRVAIGTIQPIMVDGAKGREEKRKTLCGMVDSLSDGCFARFVPQIIGIINMGEEVCREYSDSESQVRGILGWLPRMEKFHSKLLKEVKKQRRKYRLVI